jgi:hypothetical protein
MHARARIRQAVAAALTGLDTTQDRVFAGRVRPLGKDSGPALFVYSLEEDASIGAGAAKGVLDRALTLVVEGRVSSGGAADPEDMLDSIALEVETALAELLADEIVDLTLARTQMQIVAEGESIVGAVQLQYRALYRTPANHPETIV